MGAAKMRLRVPLLVAATVVLMAAGAVGMPDRVRIPIVSDHEEGDPPDAALFSHWSHDRHRCYTCHPSVFPKARVGFTHEDLDDGRYCATCHDGKAAWGVDDAECETCHVPAD